MAAPCIPITLPSLPTLPTGFSFSPPALPAIDLEANICCKLSLFSWSPVIPIPPTVINSTLLIAVNAAASAWRTYIDLLPVKCPRNP